MGTSCYKDLQGIRERINVHPQAGFISLPQMLWKQPGRGARKTVGPEEGLE